MSKSEDDLAREQIANEKGFRLAEPWVTAKDLKIAFYEFSEQLENRFEAIEKRFQSIELRLTSVESKLWTILIIQGVNLAGLGFILKLLFEQAGK